MILALGLAVSMVAGFGYYFDSAQEFTLQEGYINIFDFNVDCNNNSMNWKSGLNESHIEKIFLESELPITDAYLYREITSNKVYKRQNVYGESIKRSLVWISAQELFSSPRFHDYIKIDIGRYPTAVGEYMINSEFANEYNMSISAQENLTMELSAGNENYILENFNVVGLYSTNRNLESFGSLNSEFDNFYIFTFNNFSSDEQLYPNQDMYEFFGNHSALNNYQNNGFTLKTYLGLVYDRSTVNIAWLTASSKQINDDFQQTIFNFPAEYDAENIISLVFLEQFDFQSDIRLSVQFTNLPLYMFAIYLGSIANKSNIQKRYFEFFSMRMRGFPKKMIRNQLIVESVINSFFISILGILFGFGIFYFGQFWLNPMFLSEFNTINFLLSPFITSITIMETFLFGTILTILSSISSIRYINKMKTSEIASALTQKEGDTDYDETSLYLKEYKRQISEGAKQEELDIQNFIKRKEELNPKWGLVISFAALIPPILFLFVLLGQRPTASDILIEVSWLLQAEIGLLTIFTLFSPFVLVGGLLRYLIVESPPRFAKISKKIAHQFLKGRDYLVGIEMSRQKQYTRIIFLTGIFVSLLVFGNMSTNSLVRQSQIRNNLRVGADVKMEFVVAGQVFEDHNDIDLFGQQILDIRDSSGDVLINNYTLVYTEYDIRGKVRINQFYVNLTEYLGIIKESDKILPNPNFAKNIQKVIDYNAVLSDENVGIIVSSSFLASNDLKIGETIMFQHTSTNFQTGQRVPKIITARIFMEMDVMPGLYFSDNNLANFMIIDSHVFNYSKAIVPTNRIIQLLDVNKVNTTGINDFEQTVDTIRESSTFSTYAVEYDFYNYDWQTVNSFSYANIEVPYLGLFYFNLIIIGVVLSVGVAILVFSAQDQNKSMYGELLARGFGRKGIYSLSIVQMFIAFLISSVMGIFGGVITSIAFCKMFSMTLGGGYLNMPIFFNFFEFFLVLGMVIGLTFTFMGFSFYRQSKIEICEMLDNSE